MKVLIAVDSSEIAEKAFDWYFEKIHKPGNEIVIGHAAEVARIPSFVFLGEMAYPPEEMKAEIERLNKKRHNLNVKYKTKMEKYTDAKYKLVFEVSIDHSAEELIIKIAETEECNIIIMGSRGLGAVRRTILGSVSDYVMHHAKIPVLVCHK